MNSPATCIHAGTGSGPAQLTGPDICNGFTASIVVTNSSPIMRAGAMVRWADPVRRGDPHGVLTIDRREQSLPRRAIEPVRQVRIAISITPARDFADLRSKHVQDQNFHGPISTDGRAFHSCEERLEINAMNAR